MARKIETVVVPEFPSCSNRDKGKNFRIKEWDSDRADEWFTRAMLAFNREGGQIPFDLKGIGFEGMALIGVNTFLRGNMRADEVIPLLNELLECVTIVRVPDQIDQSTGEPVFHPMLKDDLEEVMTRYWLRSEVLRIHTGFSPAAFLSALIQAIFTKMPEILSAVQTSPPAST